MERHPDLPAGGTRLSPAEAGGRAQTAERRRYHYGAVAWCYEELAAAYSLGSIRRAKISHLCHLAPGDRVLYVGVGRGEDALLAARRGVRVTGIDLSQAMLTRLQGRLAGEGLGAALLRVDMFEHEARGPGYDAVVANFVLNVFSRPAMQSALAHLVSLVRPGGDVHIADFAAPRAGRLARAAALAYYRPVNVAAWALSLCALHPIHDYAAELQALGFAIRQREGFCPFGRGPVLYESLTACRR